MILRSFTPLIQRVIAIALLVLALLVAVLFILVPMTVGISDNLDRLRRQREDQAEYEAILAMPAPRQGRVVEPGLWVTAPGARAATEAMGAFLTGLAAQRSITLTITGTEVPAARAPAQMSISFTTTGEQSAILAFIADIEGGKPLLRLRRVSLVRQTQVTPLPSAPSSSIAPQSPNAGAAPQATTGQPVSPDGGADNESAPAMTSLQADGIVTGLWGGVR